ncbi:MAG: LCP family protein [Eubacteriales bacterium]|nr:LCP family protein [Eubacteriales bacterium]
MIMSRYLIKFTSLLMALVLCASSSSLAESSVSQTSEAEIARQISASNNPLINPDCNVLSDEHKISLQPDVINILLLGIDDQDKDYTYRNEMAHTDAIMVLSINLNENRTGKMINLISIPRDTMAYVPSVKGIYKVNGAINCGDALAVGATRADAKDVVGQSETGFQTVCSTVSWLLGGIQIDYYCAVTMDALAALGDVIGGVDYNLEMTYTGTDKNNNPKRYHKGQQHLDGAGIVSYARARHNATVDTGSDQARAGRQRDMMLAILDKLLADKSLVLSVITSLQSNQTVKEGFYTNVDATATAQFLGIGMKLLSTLDTSSPDKTSDLFSAFSLDGEYRNAFGNWKFRFLDQAHRIQVIREAFGIDVSELTYVSYDYAAWLYKSGFKAIRFLAVADEIRDFIALNYQYESPLASATLESSLVTKLALSDEQLASMNEFNTAYGDTLNAFLTVASAVNTASIKGEEYDASLTLIMTDACKSLQTSGNALAKLVGYPAGIGKKAKKIQWTSGVYMDEDPLINEIYVNFR